LSEEQLVEQVKEGDPRAFRRLYDTHVDRVYRLAYRMAGREELARDFTQEAFVRAYRKIHQFRGDAAFSTWMHSITVSVCLNGLRSAERHRKRERTLEAAAHLGDPPPSGDPGLRERLRTAIDALPDIYRTVFLMHDLEGFSHREIATALDVAEGTSKARLSRARAKLRGALGDVAEEYAI
jgi:RNA polymerase sigma-70 factor (ECF subfamily)